MDVLIIHNSYQQPGGEDGVFNAECALLRARGNRVIPYHVSNDLIKLRSRASVAAGTIWSFGSYAAIRNLIRSEKPQIVHVHNTFPLVSPAVYYAAKREGVPVVQTLHNYRLLCPAATLYRDGAVCTQCLDRPVWPAVMHRCYRGSLGATAALAAMLQTHRLLRTWTRAVNVYIALSEWSRKLFVHAGLPAEKTLVKPNFIAPDPARTAPARRPGRNALFVGRLTPEKGIRTLLRAWREIGNRVPLEIAGDGPLADEVSQAAREVPGVRWLGTVSKPQVYERLAEAEMLIVPSEWYEACPLTVLEAFAMGVPVIASGNANLEELIPNRKAGLHFAPGNPLALRDQVLWLDANAGERVRMGSQAREEFEQKYTAEVNYQSLMHAYRVAIEGRSPTPTRSDVRLPNLIGVTR